VNEFDNHLDKQIIVLQQYPSSGIFLKVKNPFLLYKSDLNDPFRRYVPPAF